MKTLRYGDRSSITDLLQTALRRAGYDPGAVDGIFGRRTMEAVTAFQRAFGLTADGIVGPATWGALTVWLLGSAVHTVRRGDSFYLLARQYGTTIRAIETANPSADPFSLQIGSRLMIPLNFPVVPNNIRYSSDAVAWCVRGLAARYPFLSSGEFGQSVTGRSLWWLSLGSGFHRVFWSAAHHGNEWLTIPVLLQYAEELAAAFAAGGNISGAPAETILQYSTIYIAPCIDPDGVDLVTGALSNGPWYDNAKMLSRNYPDIPFPEGWKANIRGVDLNLQYPAGWEEAREIKFAQGFTLPGPRDYVGEAPLTAPESLALYRFTQGIDPALILAYHSQGQIIYWKFLNIEPEGARELGERFAAVSGYTLEDTPYASGFAGFKDWFIQDYGRPGYTIEVGLGENPLPLSQFAQIYAENRGILTLSALP